MSESHTGEKNSFFGKRHTEEAKRKNAEARVGKPGPWLGKQRSEETKRKISEALKLRNSKGRV